MLEQDFFAIQWDGMNIQEIRELMDDAEPIYMAGFTNRDEIIGVPTPTELKVAHIGDWIRKYQDGRLDVISDRQVSEELFKCLKGGSHA